MPLSKTVPTNRWGWNGTPRNIWYVCQSITNLIKSLCYKICIYKLQNIAEFHNFVIMILLLILWLFLTDRLLWLTYSPCSDQIRPYIKHNDIHNRKKYPDLCFDLQAVVRHTWEEPPLDTRPPVCDADHPFVAPVGHDEYQDLEGLQGYIFCKILWGIKTYGFLMGKGFWKWKNKRNKKKLGKE